MDHELVRLVQVIEWEAIATEFRPMYCPNSGRPAVPTRLMAGLQLLKHTFNLSDEQVVARWVENPYGSRGISFGHSSSAVRSSSATRFRSTQPKCPAGVSGSVSRR
jgi:IS5 family transposase